MIADQPFALGTAPHPVCLGFHHTRRVALHPDSERVAEIERLLVGKTELSCELVQPNLCGQVLSQPLRSVNWATRAASPRDTRGQATRDRPC